MQNKDIRSSKLIKLVDHSNFERRILSGLKFTLSLSSYQILNLKIYKVLIDCHCGKIDTIHLH